MKLAAKVRSSAAICETTAEPSMTMTICDDSAGQMRCSDGHQDDVAEGLERASCARLAPASNWPRGVAWMPARMISQL